MLILGIESATQQVGCALADHDGVLASTHTARGRRHAETLTPSIEFICRQAEVSLHDVTVIAVDVGPGLFTGLRVGIATAKALAQALRVPVIPVSSLDLLAFPARFSNRCITAVVDARRGELFTADYRQVHGGVQRLTEPRLCAPVDLIADLTATREETLLVGDGALRYRDDFGAIDRVEVGSADLAYPSARSLVRLAHAQALREEWVQVHEVEPLYLRKPDAEINWATRVGDGA